MHTMTIRTITRSALALLAILSIAFSGTGLARNAGRFDDVTTNAQESPLAGDPLPSPTTDPFPATDTMTDTILAIVNELNALPQPLEPPAGAVPAMLDENEVAAQNHEAHRVYLPMIRRSGSNTTPPPTPRPTPADIAVTIWPAPSIRVARGELLTYEIRLANYGGASASSVRVRMPYPRQQVTLLDARFTPGSGDWVSAIENDAVIVTFGPLAAGARRSATLVYRVGATVANDSVINMRAAASWSDAASGGSTLSNWAPVLVGSGNATSAYLWLAVTPTHGRAGTTHRFFTDRYIPGEGVVAWLNTPTGVAPLDLRTIADRDGRVWLNFTTTGRAPGNYSLVVYGARSHLTAVAGFTVDP